MKKNFRRWLVSAFAAALSLAAAVPAFAAEMVNVTVPNVKGGYLEVTYEREDGSRVYLPVGETAQVPKGTSLEVWAGSIYYRDADDNYIRTIPYSISANGKDLEAEEWGNTKGWVAEENTTFAAAFKGKIQEQSSSSTNPYPLRFTEDKSTDTGFKDSGVAVNKQISIYDRNSKNYINLSKAESVMIVDQVFYPFEGGYDKSFKPFVINGNVLSTNGKKLEAGEYYVTVTYTYNSVDCRSSLWIYVDEKVGISGPTFVVWNYRPNSSSWSSDSVGYHREYLVENSATDTVKKYLDKYNAETDKDVIANHENIVGFGSYDYKTNSFKVYSGNDRISKYLDSNADTTALLEAIPENFKPAVIAHLDAADIIPESVKPGWNKKDGKWFYYETEDPASLAKNKWLDDGNGGEVWVGADGAMVVNATVTFEGVTWLVDAKGNKIKDQITTLDGVDYVTNSEGVVTETKIHLATPSNAEEAITQIDKVLANQNSMKPEDKVKAADMLTEALKEKVDITKLTAEETAKFEELYKSAYGAENIDIEPSDVVGGIAAAGLTSADFEDGSVEIRYVTEWLGTASNAQERVSVKLLVNGVEREKLTAPITISITGLPDEFIASYSNAKYNYKIDGASDVKVDTENGVLTMKISSLKVFEIRAIVKNSGSSSGKPGYSSAGGSGSGSGRARVKADYQKTGEWVRNKTGWWYRYSDGTWPANTWAYLTWNNEGKWYYFNADGYMMTGWLYWQNNYYYLYPYSDGNCGYMFTGWHEIGGKWYYFSAKNDASLGAMAYNTTTPDGYKVDKDGAWIR